MSSISKVICFNHGGKSEPWGEKFRYLAEIGKSKGFAVESIDYTDISNPDRRVEKLVDSFPMSIEQLILVGSSMGGYVAAVASEKLHPAGLFLLAPAFFISDYAIQCPTPYSNLTTLVHGWKDEVIPVENSIRFAKYFDAQLHILNDGHRLLRSIPIIPSLFSVFLEQIDAL